MRRGRKAGVVAAAICIAITLTAAVFAPARYVADAELVRPREPDAPHRFFSSPFTESPLEAEARIFRSREVRRELVRAGGLIDVNLSTLADARLAGGDIAAEQVAAGLLDGALRVRLNERAQILSLRYVGDDPDLTAATLNAWIDAYLEFRTAFSAAPGTGARVIARAEPPVRRSRPLIAIVLGGALSTLLIGGGVAAFRGRRTPAGPLSADAEAERLIGAPVIVCAPAPKASGEEAGIGSSPSRRGNQKLRLVRS
jgi:uncharacterized protein involved in exopolysaccharide biosynthesis